MTGNEEHTTKVRGQRQTEEGTSILTPKPPGCSRSDFYLKRIKTFSTST